jgi:GT2 family glycosyltransferase
MLVSIIIINYNTFQLTCDCIRSVIAQTTTIPFEIVLVDNASTYDNPDNFLFHFPDIILVKSPENGGFAKGNNLGICHARGDIILLLNSDTILTEDSIGKAALFLKAHRGIGMMSVRLTYANGSYQHNARKFRSIGNELLDLLRPALYTLPYRKRATLMLNQYFKGDFDTGCDWVSGAFLMFPKSLLQHLPGGKLDERFFMYGEDQLWCYQAVHAGYSNYYLADTSVIHIANASTEPAKQLKLLKTMLAHELVIMQERKGKGAYYYCFKAIFTAKEMARYYIKVMALRLFGKKIK